MAETVYLNDGYTEVIIGDKGDFLERLIREKLGDDAARCFTEYISDLQDEVGRAQTAIREQECIADDYHQMCNNALDAFGRVLELLKSPRLCRSELKGAVQAGYDDLNNNL